MSGQERGAPGLLLQMLAWINTRPRTYVETMDAWRTSCPRLSVWEDALDEELVHVDATPAVPQGEMLVRLTERGRVHLGERSAA